MGFGRILGPWKAAVLIGAVVAALLVSCESRPRSSEIFPTMAAPVVNPPRTEAEARWAYRVNALCARRNAHLYHLDYRDWPDKDLARVTSQAIEVWDDYARRVAAVRPPQSYASRVRMLAGSEASIRDGLVEIRREARAGRRRAADSAIDALYELTSANDAVLDYVGVAECAEFEPYRPRG
jgi:hypothetical protein